MGKSQPIAELPEELSAGFRCRLEVWVGGERVLAVDATWTGTLWAGRDARFSDDWIRSVATIWRELDSGTF